MLTRYVHPRSDLNRYYTGTTFTGRKRQAASSAYPPSVSKKLRITPGFTRLSGNYGRYGPYRRFGLNIEKKFFDTALAAVALTSGGAVMSSSINLVSQGNAENNFVGRKFTIKSIQMKGNLVKASNSNATLGSVISNAGFRMLLILDKQANGAALTVAELLENADINGLLRAENASRFTVIKEWKGQINSQVCKDDTGNVFATGATTASVKYFKKCNIPIEMGSTGGAITEVRTNNLALVGFCSTSDTLLTFTGRWRIRFSDF